MGVMNTMRANMAGIMIFLVVAFVLTMSVGGLVGGADITDIISGNRSSAFTVVNGEEILREEYFRSLENERDAFRQRNGVEPNDQQMNQLSEQVWDNLVTQILLSQEIKKAGIDVTEDEVRYYFTEDIHPAIQQYFRNEAGEFDYDAYQQAISAPQASSFFSAMRQQIAGLVPVEKLQRRVLANAHVSEQEVRAEFMRREMIYDVEYLHLPSSAWKDNEFTIDEAEIANYYDLNLDDYQQEERRVLSYVAREIQATPGDTTRMLNLVNDIKTDIENGADFAEQAQIHSDDPSAENGGYLGWFGRNRMVKPFEEAAFSAEIGELVGPVLTQFGYHLIKVENTRIVDGAAEIEARHILININPSETTRNTLRRELRDLEFLADEIGWQAAVDSLGIETQSSNRLRANDSFISGLGNFTSAVRFAFRSQLGDHSGVFQNDQHFAIFQLEEIVPAGPRPLEEVSAGIKRLLTNERKLAAARAVADSLRATLADDSDLAAVTIEHDGLVHRVEEGVTASASLPGVGRHQEVYGYLSAAEIGSLSPVIELPRGVLIIRLQARTPFNELKFAADKESIRNELLNKRQNEVWGQYLTGLKDKANIIDNRLKFL